MKEHEVGEVFETFVNNKVVRLKTVEDVGDELCENCIFDIKNCDCLVTICSSFRRKDDKSIHFEEVK